MKNKFSLLALLIGLGISIPSFSQSLIPLLPGSISGDQTINSGGTPLRLTNYTGASGGRAPYIDYRWMMSVDGINWSWATGTTNQATYQPPALTLTTKFRRDASSGVDAASSNIVTVTVRGSVSPGAISGYQSIASGTAPSTITSVLAASGGSGAIIYQWQSSLDNSKWANIPGATSLSYTPGVLTTSAYYRRQAKSGTATSVSNTAYIHVEELKPGSISGDQRVHNGLIPNEITSTYPASGSTAYKWQSSTNNAVWTNIHGAASATYSPPALTVTTYFRRQALAGNQSAYSNVVTITVVPLLPGTILGDQTINMDTVPSSISSVSLASGSGTISYQWQSSIDKSNWSNIAGATNGGGYQPSGLIVTTYYRRQAKSGNYADTSNIVTVNVIKHNGDNNHVEVVTFTKAGRQGSIYDITYYDGLGFPSQIVNVGASPLGKSIITPVFYNEFKLESREYLPYPSKGSSNAYVPSAKTDQYVYYSGEYGNAAAQYSYSENIYDASPLNRIVSTFNVGHEFRSLCNEKPHTLIYGANGKNEVMLFNVNNAGALTKADKYDTNTLYKKINKNEDGVEIITYIDLFKHEILTRIVGDQGVFHDTYYVYDDRGNLCYVLPPELVDYLASRVNTTIPDADIKALAYIYKYDHRNRCVEKHLPGSEPIFMVYDKGDRLVLTQDGKMRPDSRWVYTKYDNLDRVVSQSVVSGVSNRSTIQGLFNSTTNYLLDSDPSFSKVVVLVENKYGK